MGFNRGVIYLAVGGYGGEVVLSEFGILLPEQLKDTLGCLCD